MLCLTRFGGNRRTLVLIGILMMLRHAAWPQASTATLSGTVHDQTAAVIAGATLKLTNTGTNVAFTTRANEVGFYIFPGIIPGPYKLEAESPGMERYEATLLVQVGQRLTVDPLLRPGATSTTIAVADVTPMVNVKDSTISSVIDHTRIEQLPRGDRQVLAVLSIVPGMEGTARSSGLRYGSTDFALDGAPLVSRTRGTIENRQPGLDSIEEMSVDTNNVSAKYNSPATVTLSTKSGTNEFHGSLFETHVNSRVGGARSRIATNAAPPYSNRAQFGASAGGPVIVPKVYDGRNRTFWFFSYEARRQLSNSLVSYSVPTEAMRSGDFSGLVDANGRQMAIYDPWTTDPKTYQRQQFSYGGKLNVIDPAKASPLWKYLMNLTPLPTLPNVNPLISSNWIGNAATRWNDWTTATRFDHRFSDNDIFYARYSKNAMLNDTPFSGAIPLTKNIANRNAYTSPAQSLALSWVHIVSPTLFNELLATVHRQAFYQASDPTSNVDWDSQLGLSNPLGAKQWPDILSLGLNGTLYRTVYPNADMSTFYQVDDNVTKIAGSHQLTMGVHLRRDLVNYLPQQEQSAGLTQPVANWTAAWDPTGSLTTPRSLPLTGSLIASSYLGMMMYGMKTTHGYFYERANQYALYFQDNYKVTRRLTLNLGLRWQAWPAIHEKHNNISGFDPKQKAIVLAQPLEDYYRLNPFMAPGVAALQNLGVKFIDYRQAGLPRDLANSNWRDFAPRLGFAYRATEGSRPLVMRGGYSISYFPIQIQSQLEKMRAGIPFVSNPLYSPDSAGFSPDGYLGYSLRNAPTYVAGLNTRDVLSAARVSGITAGSLTGSFFDPTSPDTRVQDWNLTLEKEVLPKTLARIAWVGNHTSSLDAFRNLNPQTSQFVWVSNFGTAFPAGAGATRPYDSIYGDIIESGRYGYSNYSGMQLELNRRYSNGFSYQVFYVISNAFALGTLNDQGTATTLLPPTSYLNSQVAGLTQNQLDRMLYYHRDTAIPKQRVTWNWVADLPIGRRKALGRNMPAWLDTVVGGWEVAGYGSWNTTWFSLPPDQFPTGNSPEIYRNKYKVEDCRSGRCLSAYLWFNGYINPAQINSHDPKTGAPNGIMGVPAGYKPAFQNLIPFPAAPVPNDPNAPYYGTNTVWIPLKDGTLFRSSYGGIMPLHDQYVQSPGLWILYASLFKSFKVKERVNLRIQWDVFNPTNSPEEPQVPNAQGLLYTYVNGQSPRSMQFTVRLSW